MLEEIRRHAPALSEHDLIMYLGDLDAGEDELAWERLVKSADMQRAAPDVWGPLVEAANQMGLGSDDELYGAAVRLARRHFAG